MQPYLLEVWTFSLVCRKKWVCISFVHHCLKMYTRTFAKFDWHFCLCYTNKDLQYVHSVLHCVQVSFNI